MGCVCVGEASVYALEQFGRFHSILHPGLHFFNCLKYGARGPFSLKLRTLDFRVSIFSAENLSIAARVGVQYMIRDEALQELPEQQPSFSVVSDGDVRHRKGQRLLAGANDRDSVLYNAIYASENTVKQIEQEIDSHLRSVASKMTLQQLLDSRQDISDELQRHLNQQMAAFGYVIKRALVTDISPPEENRHAMNEMLASKNRREATLNDAEARKQAAILEAEGHARVQELAGEGVAKQRQALLRGVNESLSLMGGDGQQMSNADLMAYMLTTQWVDTLHHVGPHATFVLNGSPTGACDMQEQIRTGILTSGKQHQL